jgi:hypothetical protein
MVTEKQKREIEGFRITLGGNREQADGARASKPEVDFPLTEGRTERMDTLAVEYNNHDMRGSPCLTATADALGVRHQLNYMHYVSDIIRACRKAGMKVRSRRTVIRRATYTVQGFVTVINDPSETQAKQLTGTDGEDFPDYYLITTTGHIHLRDHSGRVVCDTAIQRDCVKDDDNREVEGVWGVWT